MLDKALSGDPARKAKILGRTPLARFGEPDDIGWAAVYLCSPASKFVTGGRAARGRRRGAGFLILFWSKLNTIELSSGK
jgi:NAD(P)-dependent dehydrogenase (short-subunit alcohol dehydrogenase family)